MAIVLAASDACRSETLGFGVGVMCGSKRDPIEWARTLKDTKPFEVLAIVITQQELVYCMKGERMCWC